MLSSLKLRITDRLQWERRTASQRLSRNLNRVFAELYYKSPFAGEPHPRRQVTTYEAHCAQVAALPDPDDWPLQDWYFRLYGETRFDMQAPLLDAVSMSDDQLFRQTVTTKHGGTDYLLPEVFVAGIHHARMFTYDSAVGSQNCLFEGALENIGLLDRVLPRAKKIVEGSYIALSMYYWRNYYHWTLEILPRLLLLEDFPSLCEVPVIVPGSLHKNYGELLSWAGVTANRLIPYNGEPWQIERLYMPSLLNHTDSPSPVAVNWIRRKVLDATKITPVRQRRLYLTRRDAVSRHIINEAAIMQQLTDRGFEVICPGDMTVIEQVRIFSQADIVVAPHGAACTNMTYAPEGAALIELFSRQHLNFCFWALTGIRRQRYGFVSGPAYGNGYEIDVKQLLHVLEAADTLSGN